MLPMAIGLVLVWLVTYALGFTFGGGVHLLLLVAGALLVVRHYRAAPESPAYSRWQQAQRRLPRR
jgi:hypothetical protein